MKVSARGRVDPFRVMEVLRHARERAAAGADVIHLEVGQPSTGAPATALAAARLALDDPVALGYTDAAGTPSLRHRIADHYRSTAGAPVDPDSIVVTTGASTAVVLAILAAFDEGDRVAVCEPGYPCYRQMLTALGCEPVGIPIDATTRFQPTPALLDAAGPLDGVIVASPSNPTGTTLTPTELAALCDWSAATGTRLISDEIYHGITFGDPAPTAVSHDVDTIVVNSFSKYWCMTGWRVGWMVVPADLRQPVERLAQNLLIAAPTLGQIAAAAAFDGHPELDAHVARYATNRTELVTTLDRIGCTDIAPADGAFYVYASVDHLTDDSSRLCETWLDELGVAATPGIDFDPHRGHRFVRFSVAGTTDDVARAARLIETWALTRR